MVDQRIVRGTQASWMRGLSIVLAAILLVLCAAPPGRAVAGLSVSGTLRGLDGTAASGLRVEARLLRDDGATHIDRFTTVRDDGTFTLSGLTASSLHVLWVPGLQGESSFPMGYLTGDPADPIHRDLSRARVFDFGARDLDLDLVVERAWTISGTLRLQDGSPVVGIEVAAVTVESGRRLEERGLRGRTGIDGRYIIHMAEPGLYRLWLEGEPLFGNGFAGAPGAEPARFEEAREIDTRRGPVSEADVSIPDVRLPADQFVLSEPLTYWNPIAGIVEVGNGALSWFSLGFGDRLNSGMALKTGFEGHTVYAPGDFFVEPHGVFNDIITVDRRGKMFLHPGGGGSLGPPRQIGHGWGSLRVVPGGDLDQDGCGDILAIDVSGRLLLYRGDCAGGFLGSARVVGKGWVGFELHAAGDLDRDGREDVLAIDDAGRLWAYAGNGDGTFATRKQVGKGWGTYTLAAGADLDGTGWADIVGRNDSTGVLYLYKGQGNGTFATKQLIATGW